MILLHVVDIDVMFALPPETKKNILSEELLKIEYAHLTKPEEIGELIIIIYFIC